MQEKYSLPSGVQLTMNYITLQCLWTKTTCLSLWCSGSMRDSEIGKPGFNSPAWLSLCDRGWWNVQADGSGD